MTIHSARAPHPEYIERALLFVREDQSFAGLSFSPKSTLREA